MEQRITVKKFMLDRPVGGHEGHSKDDEKLFLLIEAICRASKNIYKQVNKGALLNIFGDTGEVNVQGEEVKKLDIIANDLLTAVLKDCEHCAGLASEEDDNFTSFNENEKGSYVVLFDPLDGSSNIDVNVSIGTIFTIYPKITNGKGVESADFLQQGRRQAAAGYVIYGSSVMLVLTTGNGVNGFTLDVDNGEFYLTHPNIKIPADGKTYSINQSSYNKYDPAMKSYIDYCMESDKATKRPYSLRYIGSMVADFHRNLLKGGIFIYPGAADLPKGKLRLLYECNPLTFVAEQAGGIGINGIENILDIRPAELHQRTPVFLGSKEMVSKAGEMIKSKMEVSS